MSRIHFNNFSTTLNGAILDSDTSATFADSIPSLGGSTCRLTLFGSGLVEIIEISSNSGAPTYTIARAQEGTTAKNWPSGTGVECRFTADSVDSVAGAVATAWTPDIVGTSTAGTATYTTQRGTYWKNGQICFIEAYLVWTSHTGTGTNMQINGLPFAGRTGFTEQVINCNKVLNLNSSASKTYIKIAAGSTSGVMASQSGSSSEGVIGVDTGATLCLSGFYFVD